MALPLIIALAALGMLTTAVQAETYPTRPIKLIVPFPPGGPVDVMARVVVQRLSTSLGQVIIDNRPGAGGTLGSRAAAMAEPDGYTLLFGSSTTLAAGPALYRNPGYDPVKSFAPVAMISSVPFVLAVAPHFPARTVAELVAYAKANPNKLNFGAPTGTLPHLTGEMLKTRAGIDIVHIPYKGAATAITDVLSGQMDMAFEPISVMVDLILVNDRTSCTHIVAQAAEEVFLPGSPVSEPCNRVVQVSRFGGPEGLEVVDAPMPTAGRGEARVRVLASSLEYTDVPIRRHLYAQTIGQIDQLGDGVSGFQLGDQVADMTVLGSNASYRTLRADDLTRVPAGVDVTEAAAIILSWTTAYQLLHRAGDHGRLRKP